MFTYMLDFILKPGGKLEQDNASLLKFKGNPSIETYRKLRSKERLPTTRTSNFTEISSLLFYHGVAYESVFL